MFSKVIQDDVTQVLGDWAGGDAAALNELMPLVYEELRRMAHRCMAQERGDHTLQATALVNEVYLKLKDGRGPNVQNRAHFFAIAANMMRRILVDYARRHATQKRGGGAADVTLDEAMWISPEKSDEMLALDEALNRLQQVDKRRSQIAIMRFFSGLTGEEIAEALGVSVETVHRDWRLTRAWLQRELTAAA
ncbi:MAG TPA: sigma-70 family RNA polymerase sigma factor [Chthoniobacterales bacterium]|nr:sigma-70 family RNA polymerase sigma factor [Chthoniobacterales bacterium]